MQVTHPDTQSRYPNALSQERVKMSYEQHNTQPTQTIGTVSILEKKVER